jgi:hypothetical protein
MSPSGPITFSQVFIVVVIIAFSIAITIATLIIVLRKRHSQAVKFEPIHVEELIKLIVTIASFVTVCVSLFLLILQNQTIVMQTRYTHQSLESNVFGVLTSQTLLADDIFIREPDLRPYFYYGKTITENDSLYDKVKAASEYLLDFFDSQVTQLKKFPNLWRSEKDAWEAGIIDQFAWSPFLCWYLEINKEWYSEGLLLLKKKGEAKRQKGSKRQPKIGLFNPDGSVQPKEALKD